MTQRVMAERFITPLTPGEEQSLLGDRPYSFRGTSLQDGAGGAKCFLSGVKNSACLRGGPGLLLAVGCDIAYLLFFHESVLESDGL